MDYVDRAVQEGGAQYVPPSERIAVFDNDGTLWCEKPMPLELGFVLQRLAEMAEQDPSLRTRQPWQAAREKDYAWLGGVLTKHYHGDDSDVKVLLGGILQAFATISVDTYAEMAERFLLTTHHPTLGRRLRDCAYLPMVELLHYLEANGFTTYIASGGDRDFMRPVTAEIYGIPAERVIGSSAGLRYQEDDSRRITRLPGRDGRLRRRPDEARPHLEPDRPTARDRRRELQRRHPDAPVRRASLASRAPAAGPA